MYLYIEDEITSDFLQDTIKVHNDVGFLFIINLLIGIFQHVNLYIFIIRWNCLISNLITDTIK